VRSASISICTPVLSRAVTRDKSNLSTANSTMDAIIVSLSSACAINGHFAFDIHYVRCRGQPFLFIVRRFEAMIHDPLRY
jgi:hypothetical protein